MSNNPFVPSVPQPENNSDYECVMVDFDTILVRAAKLQEEEYIVVTHIESGREKEFTNKTQFWGHHSKKDGGWLAEVNMARSKGAQWKPQDFLIEDHARITGTLEDAMTYIDTNIGAIRKGSGVPVYKLFIGGEGNYRYDAAQTLPYKGERGEKPLMFLEVREEFLYKYRRKVEVVDGIEVDDKVAQLGWESYDHFLITGKHKYLLSYIDKDISMVPCPYFNYGKPELGIIEVSLEDGYRNYAKQCLLGDTGTDNIPSIPNISSELREKYGVRKGKGVGSATAVNMLKGCDTPKEMFEVVVEAYRDYYGDEPKEFISHRGDKLMWNWLDHLNDRAVLLFMLRYEGQEKTYHIRDTLEELGVLHE